MSVMLYPCMLCVALLMCLFVLCVACLTEFVNYLVKQFAKCLGVWNVMVVYNGGNGMMSVFQDRKRVGLCLYNCCITTYFDLVFVRSLVLILVLIYVDLCLDFCIHSLNTLEKNNTLRNR